MSRTLTEAQGFDEISKYETIKAEDLAKAGPFFIIDSRLSRTRYGERIVLDVQLGEIDTSLVPEATYSVMLGNQPFRAWLLTLFALDGAPVGPCIIHRGTKAPHAWFVDDASA